MNVPEFSGPGGHSPRWRREIEAKKVEGRRLERQDGPSLLPRERQPLEFGRARDGRVSNGGSSDPLIARLEYRIRQDSDGLFRRAPD